MSRRVHVPTPFQRFLPGVIRSFGPRLVLVAAGCAALLVLGGGSFMLSKVTKQPAVAPAAAKTSTTTKAAKSEVLGATTGQTSSGGTVDVPDSSAGSTTTSNTPSAPGTTPAASASASASIAVKPSFDIVIDPAAIHTELIGTIYVPFTIVRHGGLATPIKPATLSVYSGGSLTNLITLRSETMLTKDTGALVLAPIGLFPRDILVMFSATSGGVTASASFPYHISL